MAFSKYKSDFLPHVARLQCDVADFRSNHYISKLPQEESTTRQFGVVRDKWILWEPISGPTEFCDFWPELRDYIQAFPGKPEKVHISRMPPQTKLSLHRDGLRNDETKAKNFPWFDKTLRFHIPLLTNPDALLYSEGYFFHMSENDLWVMNNFKVHAATNNHKTEPRYHLIFDILPNENTWNLLDNAENDLGNKDDELFLKLWPEGNPLENYRANQPAQA